MAFRTVGWSVALLLAVACGGDDDGRPMDMGTDAGAVTPGTDAGSVTPGADAGSVTPGTDAGTPETAIYIMKVRTPSGKAWLGKKQSP